MQRRIVGSLMFVFAVSTASLLVQSCSSQTFLGRGFEDDAAAPSAVLVPPAEAGADADAPVVPLCASSECGYPFATCPSSKYLCDTNVDDDVDNCGECGNACPGGYWFYAELHMKYVCLHGQCATACDSPSQQPFADCNGYADDGCETDLTKNDSCGTCGNVCPAGSFCAPTDVTYTTFSCQTCAKGQVLCDGACVDPTTDATNCGSCGNDCSAMEADAGPPPFEMYYGCQNSECGKLRCNATWDDCNHDLSDGCEERIGKSWKNCGGCGIDCAPNQLCSEGKCVCNPGPDGCNCMSNFDSDPSNCGACQNVCPYPVDMRSGHGTASCSGGRCGLNCEAGYGNCNGDATDGCETYLRNDPRHCGSCDVVCAVGQACVEGACATQACPVDGGTR